MDESINISLNTQLENSQNFAFLREEGLAVIRRLASETWTDHNIHDPGVTLLEAFSYALTEAGSLNSLEMPDLLASSKLYASPEFFTAAQVLPSAPVTLKDFQKVLIDHPLVNRSWVSQLKTGPLGRLSVLLEFEQYEGIDLNSNTISIIVEVFGDFYEVDIALPYWDDPAILPLQSDISLTSVDFLLTDVPMSPPESPLNSSLNPWQPIAGSDSYFTRIKVNYEVLNSLMAWVVMKITSRVADDFILQEILKQTALLLQSVDENSVLKQYNLRVTKAHEASIIVRRYLKNYRNLCETFVEFSAVRIQEVAFTARVEVAPNINVETLLADIFFAVDNYISPPITTVSFADLQKNTVDTATIFEGPLPNYGFIEDLLLDSNLLLNKFYVSDIIRLIIQLRTAGRTDIQFREQLTNQSIIAVSNVSLSLYLENRNITSGAKDCLQLINNTRFIPQLSPLKCVVTFVRNNLEITYDIKKVVDNFNTRKSILSQKNIVENPDIPLSGGILYPVTEYYPLQNDLPVTYGVGRAGLPQSASIQRRAQAKQLKGYLFMYEQIIAGYFAQMAHVNEIFSARSEIKTTLYQLPLYQIPAIWDLFLDFDPNVDYEKSWEDFKKNENNSYRQILDNAIESEEQFLDRRHRMLDHLLARLGAGDEIKELSDLAFRESDSRTTLFSLSSPPSLPDAASTQQNHLQTVLRLIYDKSDFYYDLPYLDHARAQAAGLPYWRLNPFIQIQSMQDWFNWQIQDDTGNYLLRNSQAEKSETQARRRAQEAMSLGTSLNAYSKASEGEGRFRIIINSSSISGDLAESIDTFDESGANNAIQEINQNIRALWVKFSLAPLELRLQHLLRFAIKGERHKLIFPISDYFEIYDALPGKRFRLWNESFSTIYLESADFYSGENEAKEAILQEAINFGVYLEYYTIELKDEGEFQIFLRNPSSKIIAYSPGSYSDLQSAEEAKNLISKYIYRYYSLEGFYMVEHILLYPNSVPGGLIISDAANNCQKSLSARTDNYSFLISFVFPSGYARDYSPLSPLDQPSRTESQPARFRDAEFREYAERTIRKACPAHILPVVLWVDRDLNETPLPGNANDDFPSFDHFEARYFNWLNALFTDEVADDVIEPLRDDLIIMLNRLHENAT